LIARAMPRRCHPARRFASLGAACLALALLGACAKPPPTWQRADVSPEAARGVELDCHQHAIEAIGTGNNPEDAQSVHQRREQYFERCMRASGFERSGRTQ
jgi:hypothetical protein